MPIRLASFTRLPAETIRQRQKDRSQLPPPFENDLLSLGRAHIFAERRGFPGRTNFRRPACERPILTLQLRLAHRRPNPCILSYQHFKLCYR